MENIDALQESLTVINKREKQNCRLLTKRHV